MNTVELIAEINKSKKYSSVYLPFLERICKEESVKYKKDKEIIKAVKNRLHTVYGAFLNDNSVKLAEAFIEENNTDILSLSEKLLNLNTSSRERFEFIKDLYKFIFETVKSENISSILDIGCGFNPFSLPFMLKSIGGLNIKEYHAIDIDVCFAEIINKYFALLKLPQYAGCVDIISEIPTQSADIAFLFKVIPTVENCKKNRGFEIINNLNTKYIVVSFPTKTLCGKNIGMSKNYADMFEKNINFDIFSIIGKATFPNELVYILKKKL